MHPAHRRDPRSPACRPARPRLQRRLRPLALAAASLFALAGVGTPVGAAGPVLPGGMTIVQGQASQALAGNRLTVTNSAGALLDWQQFNIGAGAAVHFAQPSAASKVLNRVVGGDPTSILGSLSSNGQVWLQNPAGILFGAGARIDVASLVATTLPITAAGWQDGLLGGGLRLGDAAAGPGLVSFGAAIVNQGALRTASGGQVLLLGGAGGVRNDGLIHAPDGQVLLAAGAQVDLIDTTQPRIGVRLTAPQGDVLNLGQLLAGNGRIDLHAAVVNQQGIVRADAIGPGGSVVASATASLTLGAGSLTSASGASGGQVALDAGAGTLLASGRIDATADNGIGGQVSLLGRQVGLLDGGVIDASGATGGGAVRLGGGLRGQDAAFRNADAAFMARGASIRADATGAGDGGLVVLWGSEAMRAYGSLSARGGAAGGDGGLIETSGGWIDARPLAVGTQAPAGRAGQWLIDPYDIRISQFDPDNAIVGIADFTSSGPQSVLSTATIAAALNAGNDVRINTAAVGSGFGDIQMLFSTLSVSPPAPVTLTLQAIGNIEFDFAIVESTAAPLTVRLLAGVGGGQLGDPGSSATGGGIRISDSAIRTAGGDITLGGPTQACGPTLGCAANLFGAVVGSASRLTDAVEVRGSVLDAGSGGIRIDGHSVVGSAPTTGVRLHGGSALSARTIDIVGTVDAEASNDAVGVEIVASQLAATSRLAVIGSVQAPDSLPSSVLRGLMVSGESQLTIGSGTDAQMLLNGSVSAGSGAAEQGAVLIGLDVADAGTQLLAGSGSVIDLTGQATGSGFRVGISTTALGADLVDASLGSRLSLRSDSRMFLNAGMVAPTGGTLTIDAADGLYIDNMQLTGAPASAQLSGNVVAIGTQGQDTAVRFDGITALTVQAGQFLLGNSDGGSSGPASSADGQQQALSFAPPTGLQALLASGGAVRIRSDSVYLGLQAAVYASAEGTAIDIAGQSAGQPVRSFTNDGGATALQAPSGRWLLHAVDGVRQGSFSPGDLRADFWQYGDNPGTTGPAQGGNGFLFADAPLVSLLSVDSIGSFALVREYDGTVVADLAGTGLAFTGVRSGQRLVGAPTFADRNAGDAKPLVLAAGPGGYTAVTSDGAPVYGYGVDPMSMVGTITQRPVTLAATASDKLYDGTASATITGWTIGNLIGNDDVRVGANTATFIGSSNGIGVGRTVLAQVLAIGGADSANYSIQDVGPVLTTATILPRPLVLQGAAIADKVYDGGTSGTVTNWALGNVVPGESVQVREGTAVFATASAGDAKPVTVTVLTLSPEAENYSLDSPTLQTTGRITPRPLTLQSVSVADKVYDGSTAATVTNWSLGNIVNGEVVRVQTGSAAFATAGVGSAKPVTATVTTLDGATVANYSTDGLTAQATASITPRPLTLQGVDVAYKVYDGSAAATATNWLLGNVIAGDDVQVQDGRAVFSSARVGTAKPVLATVTQLGGAAADNYSISSARTQTVASITPATLVYEADLLTLRQGEPLPPLTGTVTGFVPGETLSLATTGDLRFVADAGAQAAPGRYAVNGTGLSALNYSFVQAPRNATALAVVPNQFLPDPEVPTTVTVATNTGLIGVLPPAVTSTPGDGRVLDAVQVFTATVESGGSRRFETLDLDRMPADAVAMALAARDAFKDEAFRSAKQRLEQDPQAADAPGCVSQQQAASGQCLMLAPLNTARDISNARVVERAPPTTPSAAPAVTTVAPTPAATAPAPAPVAAAAPSSQAALSVPSVAALRRVLPLPPDLGISLPSRQPVARAAVPQIQRKIAVLIGIDRYQDERIPQLANAVADARAVARTLAERLGYETLVLENPGKATIFRALNQLTTQVGPNDSVVLYYAGHGERIEKTGLGYWQPADADADRAETWISNADIDRLLRQLPASQLAMVSDSCFSGSLVSGERIRGVQGNVDPAALLNKRAVVVMTSGGNEPVFDSGLNGHSPFAWNLMQSLNQLGSQAIGWKPGSSVFEQVRFAVARKLPQRPQYGASSGGGHEPGADYLFEQRQLR
jgi:filamentous hemagglutinin family protein